MIFLPLSIVSHFSYILPSSSFPLSVFFSRAMSDIMEEAFDLINNVIFFTAWSLEFIFEFSLKMLVALSLWNYMIIRLNCELKNLLFSAVCECFEPVLCSIKQSGLFWYILNSLNSAVILIYSFVSVGCYTREISLLMWGERWVHYLLSVSFSLLILLLHHSSLGYNWSSFTYICVLVYELLS